MNIPSAHCDKSVVILAVKSSAAFCVAVTISWLPLWILTAKSGADPSSADVLYQAACLVTGVVGINAGFSQNARIRNFIWPEEKS